MLASGQALLAVTEPDTHLAQLITEHSLGWVIPPSDINSFDDALSHALDPNVLSEYRHNCLHFTESYFSKEAIATKWYDLFMQLS